jgi:hypothetical protein
MTIQFELATAYAHELGFESDVEIRGCHWDGDHTFPFSTTIRGLWLRAAALKAIHDDISMWVNLPMSRLVSEELTRSFQLAHLPGQRLSVQFGPDIHSSQNLAVSIVFSVGEFRGEVHFVTDQSCLNLFMQDLRMSLRGVHETIH